MTPPSTFTVPAACAATSASAVDVLASATSALTSLVDSGVSLHDPRVATLLSLISRFKAAHGTAHCSRSPTSFPSPPPGAVGPNSAKLQLDPHEYRFSSRPSGQHQPQRHDAPSPVLPVAARHSMSTDRSFLAHNQATIAASRLALELSSSTCSPNGTAYEHGFQTLAPKAAASAPTTPPHPPRHGPFTSPTQNTSAAPSTTPTFQGRNTTNTTRPAIPAVSDPQTVFQIARTVASTTRRPSAKRKDAKHASQNPSFRSVLSPRRRVSSSSAAVSANLPFSAQACGHMPAEQTFQIKAQVDAFRRLIRGLDIPTEVVVAARGTSASVVESLTVTTPVIQRGVADLEDGTTSLSNTDPSLNTLHTMHFDPRRLPRFDLNHVFIEEDVRLPHEKELTCDELRDRLALAQAYHNRLCVRLFAHDQTPHTEKQVRRPDSHDARVREECGDVGQPLPSQHNEQFISPIPVMSSFAKGPASLAPPGSQKRNVSPLVPNGIPEKKEARRHIAKHVVSFEHVVPHSVELEKASVRIAVSSTPERVPTLQLLLQLREKQIAARLRGRLQEITDMLGSAGPDVRQALLVEQKQLQLLPLQKKLRHSVVMSMHGALSRPGVSDISGSRVAKTRRLEPLTTHPSGRAGVTSSDLPSRTEMSYRHQQQSRRHARRSNMLQSLMSHTGKFRSFGQQRVALKKRLFKDLDRYFRERSREEERRRKKEQIDRLRALRNKNEDEYLELLKNTKNKRLIQLLRQTDEYLMQIGAQVERQKQRAREEEAGLQDPTNEAVTGMEDNGKVEGEKSPTDDDELSQLRKRRNDYYTITHTISEKVHQPKCLVGGKLKPYQLEGLEWLVSLYNNNLNGILADEMGLGKTIQTLSLITYLVEVKNVVGPFLVIVPLSVVSNWMRELERWAPSLGAVVYKGDPATRRQLYQTHIHGGGYHVLLTTYEYVVKDKNVLGRVKWKYIIMDEGHRMKNAECKLALTLGAKYTSRNRLLLTGTPLQNNMTELWALLNFLLPSIFSSAETFETWFNAPFQASSLGETTELNEEENLLIISRLHQVLRPFMLRRLKTEVEAQLPDKVEIVLRCDMSIWQRVLYRQMRNRLGIAGGAGNVGIRSFNNMVMQLKKVCNHPFLFYNDEELRSIPSDFLMRAAGKFELLDHILRKLKRTGHRVLLFSQMTAALDYLEYFMPTINMKYLRLDGTTKADDRQEMLEVFNAKGSEYSCFLLSTRAGGLGLNLQTADTVIIFDSDWNPMMDLQAQDRAHRIGQTREVRVFRLICSGSIEVKILERATRKLQVESQVIQAGQFNNKSSDNDRHEMLKDMLKQQTEDDDFAKEDVSSLDEINRYLARGDGEIDVFESIDAELREAAGGKGRLLEREDELPRWVFKPEEEEKLKDQVQADYILEHGRGRRKRKQVVYDDNLTEREWAIAMEEEGDVEEAARRKRRKTSEKTDREVMSGGDRDDDKHAADEDDSKEQIKRRRKLSNGKSMDVVAFDGDDGESSAIDVDEVDSTGGSHTNGKSNMKVVDSAVHEKANGATRGRKRGRSKSRRQSLR